MTAALEVRLSVSKIQIDFNEYFRKYSLNVILQVIYFWSQLNSANQLTLEVIKISVRSLLWFELYLVDNNQKRRVNMFSFL